MADNPSTPEGVPPSPLSPLRGTGTGNLPAKKGAAGKIVVMLSSVAKPPPAGTQAFSQVAPLPDASPKLAPAHLSPVVRRPPPLPVKQVAAGAPPLRVGGATEVKLPPKTGASHWPSLSGSPVGTPPVEKQASPPETAPVKQAGPPRMEPKKTGAQNIPPIKLNQPSPRPASAAESIFVDADASKPVPAPEGWKPLEPGELTSPSGDLQSLEVFSRSQRLSGRPESPIPVPQAVATPDAAAAPVAQAREPLRPPPLPSAKPSESSGVPLHIAPPMTGKASESSAEKLRPPLIPSDAPEPAAVLKAPAMIQTESPPTGKPLPAKPLAPPSTTASPASPGSKVTGPITWRKKTSPIILASSASTSQSLKPALRPPVLPDRVLANLKAAEGGVPSVEPTEKKPETDPPTPTLAPETVPAAKLPEAATPPVKATEKKPVTASAAPALETSPSAKASANVPVAPATKAPLPLTRAARAKKRRLVDTLIFYLIFLPVTVGVLFFSGFFFSRETRVEGQVIPPPGMTLNNEVWIVSDFRELASGITDDLTKERAPLMQEIQERKEHVQRAQGDVASREERIRLINAEIQTDKDEVGSIFKQARDETQQLWDGPGAQIDKDYESRLTQLQKAISDRATALHLKYEPDDSFHSPEVWANAYRLALYEVPPGVDSAKEHQWLNDQMKQWRDFVKALDARREQLRERAALIKTSPASRIADLNAQVDELQHRIDSTAAEEEPIKVELQQAQTDLAQAQAAEAGLDDKYYQQLDSLPAEAITKHIPLASNGRFTWVVEDSTFAEGEREHGYWMFARATRSDGRQYWALGHFIIKKNHKLCLLIEPDSFISTKAYLRPDLSSEEQEQ